MPKKKHHKQPVFYLKGFQTDLVRGNPKVWVYKKGMSFDESKNEKKQNPQPKVPESTAYQKCFYSFIKDDGKKEHDKYENLLMEIEERAKEGIEKIREYKEINDDDKNQLVRYIASMLTRGDYARLFKEKAIVSSKKRIEGHVFSVIKEDERQEVISQSIDEKLKWLRNSEGFVQKIIQDSKKITRLISGMRCYFLVSSKETPYITSDNPVYYESIKSSEGQIIFPVSSFVTLLMCWTDRVDNPNWERISSSFWKIDSNTVELIRENIALNAIKEVYFSKKAEWLVSFINNRNNN